MDLDKVSRKVAYLLRHSETFIDKKGWAKVSEIVKEVKKVYPEFNEDLLHQIVREDEKGRYSFDQFGIRIRANQGHSVPVEIEMEEMEPPKILYHGTATRFLDSILKEGLNGQTRLYVHLSWDVETAKKVGSRHGKPVILKVDAGKMYEDGYVFLVSANQVWQTREVPPQYLEIMYL